MLKYLRPLKNEAVFIFLLIITYFIRLLKTPESSGLENYTTVHKKKKITFSEYLVNGTS